MHERKLLILLVNTINALSNFSRAKQDVFDNY